MVPDLEDAVLVPLPHKPGVPEIELQHRINLHCFPPAQGVAHCLFPFAQHLTGEILPIRQPSVELCHQRISSVLEKQPFWVSKKNRSPVTPEGSFSILTLLLSVMKICPKSSPDTSFKRLLVRLKSSLSNTSSKSSSGGKPKEVRISSNWAILSDRRKVFCCPCEPQRRMG